VTAYRPGVSAPIPHPASLIVSEIGRQYTTGHVLEEDAAAARVNVR